MLRSVTRQPIRFRNTLKLRPLSTAKFNKFVTRKMSTHPQDEKVLSDQLCLIKAQIQTRNINLKVFDRERLESLEEMDKIVFDFPTGTAIISIGSLPLAFSSLILGMHFENPILCFACSLFGIVGLFGGAELEKYFKLKGTYVKKLTYFNKRLDEYSEKLIS